MAFLDPIGSAVRKATGGSRFGSIVGSFLDPAGAVNRAVGEGLSGNMAGFLDPAGIGIGEAIAGKPPSQTASGSVQTEGQGASVEPFKPTLNTYQPPQAQGGAGLNTYAAGTQQAGGKPFSTAIGEDVLGPFNQGGQKAVKKVTA